MENLTLEALASVFGQPVEDFTALFAEQGKEGESPKPLTGDAVVSKLAEVFKAETNRFYAEGTKKGKRERMLEFEKNIRAKYGATLNQEGEALIDAVVAAKTGELETLRSELETLKSKGPKSLKEIDENEAKAFIVNHPFFKTEIEQREAAVKAKEQEFEQFKSEIENRQILSVVERQANEVLMQQFRPKLPENATVAKNIVTAFVGHLLSSAKFKLGEDNNPQAIDDHGDPVKDENFRELNFSQFVLSKAPAWFEQHPVDPNKSAPGANGQTNGQGAAGIVIPDWSKMSDEDAANTILNASDLSKKLLLSESYSLSRNGK